MKITVRPAYFNNESRAVGSECDLIFLQREERGFLKSLKIDADNCSLTQELHISTTTEFKVFGVTIKLKDNLELLNEKIWEWHFENNNGISKFYINDKLIFITIASRDPAFILHEFSTIPKNIKYISLDSEVAPIENLNFITQFTELLYFRHEGLEIKINDLTPLTNLKKIKKLELSYYYLNDASCLKHLNSLEYLDFFCEGLENIDSLSHLKKLEYLSIHSSELKNINSISNITNLRVLRIGGTQRIKSIEPIRGLKNIESIDININPALISEILAWNTSLGKNVNIIKKNAILWLSEAAKYGPEQPEDQEKLTRSLGMAFSLLDEHEEIIPKYEAFLDAHPEFGIAPWKAWFLGTKENWGFEFLKKRIEKIPLSRMFPSAIGGACAAMPTLDAPVEEVEWARGWLADLENERSGNAKELLPVAPEICLAYARLGEMETLGRWLERLTDPSDPGALDELQVSLARWRLSTGDLNKARSHISAIHSPTARDPILAELVLAELAADPDTASEDLLLVQGTETRGDLAKKLAAEPTFTKSESRLHRLLIAAGENPTALVELITLLGASVPSEIVNRLSAQLGLPQAELQQWRITQLETLLKQLQTIAKI